jgi:hypothetical protein
MPSSCRISSFIPRGLIVESETFLNAEIVLTVRAAAGFAVCPLYSAPSRRIHSRYLRHASDLPCSGHCVRVASSRGAFAAHLPTAQDRYSPNDSGKLYCRCARAGRADSKVSSITSAWRLAAGQRPPSPGG